MKDNSAIFNSIYNALCLSKIDLPDPEELNFKIMPIGDYLKDIGLGYLLENKNGTNR